MKILRICLLTLLAVLLPVRGALAVAMACPHAPANHAHHHGDMHAADPASVLHATLAHVQAEAEAVAGGLHDHQAGHAPLATHACASCDACCFTVALRPTFSPTVAALEVAAAPLPPVLARVPARAADGPERPPRSI